MPSSSSMRSPSCRSARIGGRAFQVFRCRGDHDQFGIRPHSHLEPPYRGQAADFSIQGELSVPAGVHSGGITRRRLLEAGAGATACGVLSGARSPAAPRESTRVNVPQAAVEFELLLKGGHVIDPGDEPPGGRDEEAFLDCCDRAPRGLSPPLRSGTLGRAGRSGSQASARQVPGRNPKKLQVLILTGYNMHDWRHGHRVPPGDAGGDRAVRGPGERGARRLRRARRRRLRRDRPQLHQPRRRLRARRGRRRPDVPCWGSSTGARASSPSTAPSARIPIGPSTR